MNDDRLMRSLPSTIASRVERTRDGIEDLADTGRCPGDLMSVVTESIEIALIELDERDRTGPSRCHAGTLHARSVGARRTASPRDLIRIAIPVADVDSIVRPSSLP
jgi:hypothetical protein